MQLFFRCLKGRRSQSHRNADCKTKQKEVPCTTNNYKHHYNNPPPLHLSKLSSTCQMSRSFVIFSLSACNLRGIFHWRFISFSPWAACADARCLPPLTGRPGCWHHPAHPTDWTQFYVEFAAWSYPISSKASPGWTETEDIIRTLCQSHHNT